MSRWICLGLSTATLAFGLGFLHVPAASAQAPALTGGVQWVASDFLDDAAEDWDLGMGFNLTGILEMSRTFDLRGDWGARWAEGEGRLVRARETGPDFGGEAGEITDGIRVMPFTLDLVYRFEDWSQGRYWLPYAAAGFGYYDMRARFLSPDGQEVSRNLYRSGWNLRGGVQLHRTSGLFVTLESAVHLVDTPGQWSPLYDLSLGIGAYLPGR